MTPTCPACNQRTTWTYDGVQEIETAPWDGTTYKQWKLYTCTKCGSTRTGPVKIVRKK